MLSHDERAELDKIEHWFETADPALATALRRGKPIPSTAPLLVLTVLLDVTAAGLLTTGLLSMSPALTLCALLAAAGGAVAHLAHFRERR